VKGKEALRKMVGDSKNIPGFSISWRSSDINFSPDGKLAYVYGENLMTMNDSAGKTMSIPGRGYTIWRKESDGNWKCIVDMWNNPPAK
jgi:ketosteroid isomerase-like protein